MGKRFCIFEQDSNHTPCFMTKKTHWGILGLGKIAHKFARDLALVSSAELTAVASSSKERALAFADTHGAAFAYDNYTSLYQDEKVEVIYIAGVHTDHHAHSCAALAAGKAVLCEKPLGINAREVKEMIEMAKGNNVFFMEALWSRFNPALNALKKEVEEGKIGELKHIQASFSMARLDDDPKGRLLNTALGGGSILDIGIYPVFLAYFFLGMPEEINAKAHFNEEGTEIQTSIIFHYPQAQAQLYSSLVHPLKMEAKLFGKTGEATIHPTWHEAESFTLNSTEQENTETHTKKGLGYVHEIEEVHFCLKENQKESSLWSHRDSLNLISILDEVRKKAGVSFPKEG